MSNLCRSEAKSAGALVLEQILGAALLVLYPLHVSH